MIETPNETSLATGVVTYNSVQMNALVVASIARSHLGPLVVSSAKRVFMFIYSDRNQFKLSPNCGGVKVKNQTAEMS